MKVKLLDTFVFNESIEAKQLVDKLIRDKHYNALRSNIFCLVEMEMEAEWHLEFEKYDFGLKSPKGFFILSKIYLRIASISYQTLRKIYLNKEYNTHPDWIVFYDFIEKLEVLKELITSTNERSSTYPLNLPTKVGVLTLPNG